METTIEPSRGDTRNHKADPFEPNLIHMEIFNDEEFKEVVLKPYPHFSYGPQTSFP